MVELGTKRRELSLAILIIVLSGSSVSYLILGSLSLFSYDLLRTVLVGSIVAIFLIGVLGRKKYRIMSSLLFKGMTAGAIATLALEVFRIPGYLLIKWIPMDDMIMLPGMLLTGRADSIMEIRKIVMESGVPMNLFIPPLDALMAGSLWHFWNGATFGIVYSLFVGKGKWWYGVIWGFIIEIGMMLAPWLIMMKGPFGIDHMDGYNIFVMSLIAHLAFGAVLGLLVQKWNTGTDSIFSITKEESSSTKQKQSK